MGEELEIEICKAFCGLVSASKAHLDNEYSRTHYYIAHYATDTVILHVKEDPPFLYVSTTHMHTRMCAHIHA